MVERIQEEKLLVDIKMWIFLFLFLQAAGNVEGESCNRMLLVNITIDEKTVSINTIDCRKKLLKEIPQNLSIDVEALYLSYNFIRQVNGTSFINYKKLKYINLDYNPLSTLPLNLFSGLKKLEQIHISNGGLNNIQKDTFKNLPNLRLLKLDFNRLKSIEEDVFENIDSIEEIHLTGNMLTTLPGKALSKLSNLKRIFLDLNRLKSLPNSLFTETRKLEEIYLDSNKLNSTPPSLAALPNLRKLDLSYNDISAFPASQRMENLTELNLMNCKITEITANVASYVPNLKILRLNDNKLTAIDDNTLKSFGNLEHLDLLGNAELKLISKNAFYDLEKLKILNLGRIGITTIDEEQFKELENIVEISLIGTKLSKLPKKLFEKKSKLESLYLSNTGLVSIEGTLFKDLTKLKNLYINNNQIRTLEDKTFHKLINLQFLQLDNNFLTEITSSLLKVNSQLTDLYINENSVKSIAKDAFQNLAKLERLHLRKNKLEKLESGLLHRLKELTNLHLRDNKDITELKLNFFRYNKKLEAIDLTAANVNIIPPTTFENQKNLRTIRGSYSMYCTYKSLYQMINLRKKGIFRGEFSCTSSKDVTSTKALENEQLMHKFINKNMDNQVNQTSEVYVAVNGSRDSDCGSMDKPCNNIADVLFRRNHTVTIYLQASYTKELNNNELKSGLPNRKKRQVEKKELQARYHLPLPLNLMGSVSFKKYPEDSKYRPVIHSSQPRVFIIRNDKSFNVDKVDFEMEHQESILLDVDSKEYLNGISIKNSKIIGRGKTGVSLKIYQSIGNFSAENVDFEDGTLLHIEGTETQSRDSSWTIEGTFYANNVKTKYLMKIENVKRSSACKINRIIILKCQGADYGLYFDGTVCTVNSIKIKSTKLKQSGIEAKSHTSDRDYRNQKVMGRYLYNFPDYEDDYGKENGNFTFGDVFIYDSNFTTAVLLSNIEARITNKFRIKKSSMEYIFDMSNTELEGQNIEIFENKVFRTIINHKMGKLLLDNLHIGKNEGDNNKRAIVFQAKPDEKGKLFKLKNSDIDWNKNNLTHPPIIDLYLGKGAFDIDRVLIKSYSKVLATLTSIEVETDYAKSSILKNLTIHCNVNSDSIHMDETTIRGEKLDTKCDPCDIGKYTQQNSFLRLRREDNLANETKLFKQIKKVKKAPFKCIRCPVGGSCENGIKSSGNFYGYEGKKIAGSVVFMACPKAYCCTKEECVGVNSCRKLRTGRLCGSCSYGFQEDFFSDKCIPTKNCKNITLFWLFYAMSALVVSVLFLYMKDIIHYIRVLKMTIINYFQKTGYIEKTSNEEKSKDDKFIKIGTEEQRGFTMSGCFNIIVGFYQIRSLLTVDVGTKYKRANTYQEKITKFMDLDFSIIHSLCPMKDLTSKGEGFVKNQLVVILMLSWAFLFLLIYYALKLAGFFKQPKTAKKEVAERDSKDEIDSPFGFTQWKELNEKSDEGKTAKRVERGPKQFIPITFAERVGLGMIKIILFGYKNVATFAIVAFHCVEVEGENVMFTHGDTICYKYWQIISMMFFGLWVVPFPAALMVSYRMYMRNVISLQKFVMCLVFPFASIYLLQARRTVICLNTEIGENERMVTLYLKENFEEAYRKRVNKGYNVFWETWRLYQRLILAVVTTYAINPVERICFSAPIILFFIFVYWFVKPYKKQYRILHWMEVIGLLGITFTLVNNMFRSFLYVFEIPDEKPVPQSLSVLWALDTIASPIFVLPFFLIVKPCMMKVFESCNMKKRLKVSKKKQPQMVSHGSSTYC